MTGAPAAGPLSRPKWGGALAKAAAAVGSVAAPTAAAAVGTGSSATHPLPLPPPEEEAAGNDDADGDEDVAAGAAVMALAAAAKGKATRKDTAVVAKKPAAAKYAALKRPAAAKQPTNKRPAAAGMGGAPPPAPKMVKAKCGWHTQTYHRITGTDHGCTYTIWVEPSGKRHRSRTSAEAAGFVG